MQISHILHQHILLHPSGHLADIPTPKAACDRCRQRRIRCIKKANGGCVNCNSIGSTCNFLYVRKPRGRKKGETKRSFAFHQQLQSRHGQLPIVFEFPLTNPSPPDLTESLPSQPTSSLFSTPPPIYPTYDMSMPHFNDLKKYSLSLN
ncbi:hypothetical protein DSO57_1037254 [Entomophthora muscae]|uniref:Uncharacterized protein n=2 Tax=Entomophthora muscae TaxID=34485 RepID=A0ACC2SW75_9FUNG|nr:hypothetical protein DSO57_1008497 [Entomophthora muscae]KAJ9087032.1 hypothetical protein DSO57_1037254 [Entomophthora muscae]